MRKNGKARSGTSAYLAGSGITFEDFGIHVLKGVPDDWQLYRVADLARADAVF